MPSTAMKAQGMNMCLYFLNVSTMYMCIFYLLVNYLLKTSCARPAKTITKFTLKLNTPIIVACVPSLSCTVAILT